MAKLRVPGGFVLVTAFAAFSRPSRITLIVGLPVCLAGLALRAWAAGNLAKDRELAQSGPYALVRNPLYLGTLLVAGGFVVASASVALGVVFATVFLLVYLPVIELEEQHLRDLFPRYGSYALSVPALFPTLHPAGAMWRFQPVLYWKNREYQALLGFLLGAAWLVWKSLPS